MMKFLHQVKCCLFGRIIDLYAIFKKIESMKHMELHFSLCLKNND